MDKKSTPFSIQYSNATIFEQPNQEDPKITAYNDVEIAGITQYLFADKEIDQGQDNQSFIGDAENGEKLFSSIGCMGCHGRG